MAGTDTLEQRPYRFETDSDGFIVPSRPNKTPDINVAFLGGSTTETLYVDPDFRFPHLFSRKLEDVLGVTVNGINSGVSGNHSMHSNFILMSKILPLQPDFAVLMHAGNDLGIMLHLGSYWNDNPHRSIVIREIENPKRLVSAIPSLKSFIYASLPNTMRALKTGWAKIKKMITDRPEDYNLLRPEEDEFAAVRGNKIELATERFLKDFKKSLRTFVNICRVWNITPVLMTQANRLTQVRDELSLRAMKRLKKQGLGYDVMRDVNLKFQQAIRNIAKEEGVLLIDLHRLVPQTNAYMYDALHYNNTGSALVADIITQAMIPSVKARLVAKQAIKQ
jgi:lysophospholipase L1-like esterase